MYEVFKKHRRRKDVHANTENSPGKSSRSQMEAACIPLSFSRQNIFSFSFFILVARRHEGKSFSDVDTLNSYYQPLQIVRVALAPPVFK